MCSFLIVFLQDHQTPEHSPSPTRAPASMSPDWERNALLEKMIRIQRDNAKKSEKIDFLEEHVQDLTAEIKKKNRILQFYFQREESGSVSSEASDRHKVWSITTLPQTKFSPLSNQKTLLLFPS